MHRRALRICLCLSPLVLAAALLALFAFALPPQYNETYLGGFADKMAVLRAALGKRIIFTGGSGAAFALRSDLMEEELPDYSVVNLGMYAGLGSTVPLDAVAGELREGDIVVFFPEQSGQTLSLYFGSDSMWQAADGHWALLSTVRRENRAAMMGQFPYFAAQKARYFFGGTPPRGDGVYARASFNAWGDIAPGLRRGNTMPSGYDPNTAVDFSLPAGDFIDAVNRYAALCRDRGARFFFGFCPMNNKAPVTGDREAYEKYLSSALSCPVLGRLEDSMLDAAWFFDTNFHLNDAGAVLFTAAAAGPLKKALGLGEDISIPVPVAPDTARAEMFSGDDSDADAFIFEDTPEGLMITGMTEKGAARRALTLPAAHQGHPVIGLDAAVFAGNTVIEEITVQKNIRNLPDGAFAGCDHLRALILKGVSPAACSVGPDLLKDTEALIWVDRDLLAAYHTNYFWAVHAPRIRGLDHSAADTEPGPATEESPADTGADAVIRYDANGGFSPLDPGVTQITAPASETHLRTNTLAGPDAFIRPGYILYGWNTQSDGSGTAVGLGSRTAVRPELTLYAQWAEETPAEQFTWEQTEDTVRITGWRGTAETCAVPATINGLPVKTIASDAFRNAPILALILPSSVTVIEPGAFAGASLHTLTLSDAVEILSDDSFADCAGLTTLHINAAAPPRYSISYYAAFADKYDWLLSLEGQKKLVLFSGSSTRYGYDSAMLRHYYPEYQVANMGVYAYTNALPQMELILPCLSGGDVLLHAPEFDCLNFQMCENNALDFHFWAMMEANYDCVSVLDLRDYSRVFDSFRTYLDIRREMAARSYEETPNGYDDDGNDMRRPTYNQYGDFIMPRANNKVDIMLKFVRSDYTTAPFTPHRIASINREYQRFLDRGVRVLFTYTPRNRSSLTEESTPENRKALEQLLKEQLCVPVISKMENSLLSGIYFFVIDSHLSNEGVRLFTLQIVQDLAPWMK